MKIWTIQIIHIVVIVMMYATIPILTTLQVLSLNNLSLF